VAVVAVLCGFGCDGDPQDDDTGDDDDTASGHVYGTIAAGFEHSCATLAADSTVQCWGNDEFSQSTPP
jgi:hypothetical protein